MKIFEVIDKQTGLEADIEEIANTEEWAKFLMSIDMEGWAIDEQGTLFLQDECGNMAYPPDTDRFKILWNPIYLKRLIEKRLGINPNAKR